MDKWIPIVCVSVTCLFVGLASTGIAQERVPFYATARDGDRAEAHIRRPMTDDEIDRVRQQEQLLNFDAATSPDHGASIDERLMAKVKDNTLGVRYEEREAYLRILRLVHEVPIRRLERTAADLRNERYEAVPSYRQRSISDFPQVVDLFTHPETYRGRPVTLHGIMRKLTKFDLGKNSLDLDQAYEGWVYTPDCQGNPVVVVFTSKDDRLPVKGDIQEEVKFTGYFFKMYGYEAYDTTRKAPLILAGEVESIPHQYQPIYHRMSIEWYVATTLAFLIGCYLVWQTNLREMPRRPALQVDPDFNHIPPRQHPAADPHLSHSIVETEDS